MKKSNFKNTVNLSYGYLLIVAFMLSSYVNLNAQDTTATPETRKIQIAIILDTSGSMEGLIEQAKSQLWLVVSELTKATYNGEDPVLEIALYEYGNDRFSQSEGWVRQISPLITDLDDISTALFAMKTNGGSEFCGVAIQKTVMGLEWSSSDKDVKMIFIAGNEPFTQGPTSYEAACGNARGKGIFVNTIHCGNFDVGIKGQWKSGAIIGGGDYMSIEQNRRKVYIESPYDDKSNELGLGLNKTYVYYGTKGRSKKQQQETEDANATTYSKSNMTKRNSIKASKYYKTASWDLVDAVADKKVDLKEVDKSTLPTELKTMTDAELEAYVKKQTEQRANLKMQISVLNNQRDIYVAKQKSKSSEESLESSMVNAIKKQALSKNYSW